MANPSAVSMNFEQGLRLADNSQLIGLLTGSVNFTALSMGSPAVGTYGLFWEAAVAGITATAGGGQTNAYQLNAEINSISTVATLDDSVKLPPANPGLTIMVINRGTNACRVFGVSANPNNGNAGDTIDDVATATGVRQMPNSVVWYSCATVGLWYAEGLATGFAGQLQTVLTTDGITANATGTQATATALVAQLNRVSTAAASGASVKLPSSAAGLIINVINDGASVIQVFGSGASETIDGTTAGAQITALRRAQFFCSSAGTWQSAASSKAA